MKNGFFVVLLISVLSGCAAIGNSALENPALLNSIVANKTTATEVLAKLGQPNNAETEANGDKVWSYYLATGNAFSGSHSKNMILRIRKGLVIAKDVGGMGM